MAQCPYTLQWVVLLPLKVAPSQGSWTPNMEEKEAIRVLSPNDTLICSAIFAGLTIMTDRPTYYTTPSLAAIAHTYAVLRRIMLID